MVFEEPRCGTRGARGEAKLNRTLSAPSPASIIAPVATSQKFSLTIFLLRSPSEKNSKKEREISARFRPPSIRAVWRGFNSDSVLRKLFSGDMDFRKTETNLFLDFVRPQKGVWGMNAGGLNLIFWRWRLK